MKEILNKLADEFLISLDKLPHISDTFKYVKGSAEVINYNKELATVSIKVYHRVTYEIRDVLEVIVIRLDK